MGAEREKPVSSENNDSGNGSEELSYGIQNLTVSSSFQSEKAQDFGVKISNQNAESVEEEDKFKEVDQFLRQALRNPRDRINILRMDLQIQKFMQNPNQYQFEFEPLPTSYLRLAAHRVAQHYGLQTMVLDWNSPDGCGSRIVARKRPETRFPSIRLSDIPVNSPNSTLDVKFAIKQRPHRGFVGTITNGGVNINHIKSVEERNEEYNRARARIFKTDNHATSDNSLDDTVNNMSNVSSGVSNSGDEKQQKVETNNEKNNDKHDQSSIMQRVVEAERELGLPEKNGNNRIAIFRDHEKDRNDPDYDRSYDRYAKYAEYGVGLSMDPFDVKHLYNSSLQYNLKLPSFGQPVLDSSAWVTPESAYGYVPSNAMMNNFFDSGYLSTHSTNAMQLNFSQFTYPNLMMTYVYPPSYLQQSIPQSKAYTGDIQRQ
eukprot:TRINITY_DN40320_c0_g1_i1.p1 TRINITY_DN40320_c0_g1~~TRINITY_DN40320_c0_g1_i1.p1  ORF type:complete len:429 (-),score=84.14 TRINITY_DN40320_c0_g1_i1:253-1539(-)